MNRKISIITLVFLVIISSISYAKNNIKIKYSIIDDNIISQLINEKEKNVELVNQYKVSNYLTRKENYKLENFNMKDKKIKNILNAKGDIAYLEIPNFQVRKGAKIESIIDNLFISADILSKESGKFIHNGDYIFMDGKVILNKKEGSKITEKKEITTLEEYNMIKNNSLNKKYWNEINYEKGGSLILDELGYYVISIKDEKLDTKEIIFLTVVDEKVNEQIKEEEYIGFKDVKKGSWYYDDVLKASNNKIIIGRDDNTFDPMGKLTLAEAITLSSKIRSKSENDNFEEGGSRWYDNAIYYALEKNIIKIGDFIDYNKKATREEMAYIFSSTLSEDKYIVDESISAPIDINSDDKYYDNIMLLYKSSILKGRDDGKFDAKSNITRAEAATIINRLVK